MTEMKNITLDDILNKDNYIEVISDASGIPSDDASCWHPRRLNPSTLSIEQIIDLDMLQMIQDAFARVTGVSSTVMRDGKWLTTPSNTIRLCMDYYRLLHVSSTSEEKRCHFSDCLDSEHIQIIYEHSNPKKAPFWIYRCHSGLVDFCTPILDRDGCEIARIYGGQVALAGEEISPKVAALAQEAGASPKEAARLVDGLRLNRRKTLHEMIAAASLAHYIGESIVYLHDEQPDGAFKPPLVFSYDVIHRILARAAVMSFDETLLGDSPTAHVFSRLYFLDSNTNTFVWKDHLESGVASSDAEGQGALFYLSQNLWDVFKGRHHMWILPCDGVPRETCGLYLPVQETNRVLGVLHICFPEEAYKTPGYAPLHFDKDFRVAYLAMREIANLHRNREILDLMERKSQERLWVKGCIDNVLTVREYMEKAARIGNGTLFWYAFLTGLTHGKAFSFNRAAVYKVEVDDKEESVVVKDVFAIGCRTRGEWNVACLAVPQDISVVLTDLEVLSERTGTGRREPYGRDLDYFDKEWTHPSDDLLREMYICATRTENQSYDESIFEYVTSIHEEERNRINKYWYAGAIGYKEDLAKRYILCHVSSYRGGNGQGAYLLYLDDLWLEVYECGKGRREYRRAMAGDRLLERYVVQTRTMLTSLDIGRGLAGYLSHTLLKNIDSGLGDWEECQRLDSPEEDRSGAYNALGRRLKMVRNLLAIHARADRVWEAQVEYDAVKVAIEAFYLLDLNEQADCLQDEATLAKVTCVVDASEALFGAAMTEILWNCIFHGGPKGRQGVRARWEIPTLPDEGPLRLIVTNSGLVAKEVEAFVNGDAPLPPPSSSGQGLEILREWMRRFDRIGLTMSGRPAESETDTIISFGGWKREEKG